MSWDIKKLSEVCSYDKNQGIHKSLPYIGLENIESSSGRLISFSEGISDVKSSTFMFSKEHLLYGRLRPYLNKVYLPTFTGHCSTEIFPIKPKKGLLREYLWYWFIQNSTVNSINATCTGARMPRANMNAVMDFTIPVPPISTQQKIVAKLDAIFSEIDKATASAEANAKNAEALFQSYLTQVFERSGEGWITKSLLELASEDCSLSYGIVQPGDDFENGLPIVRPTNLTRKYIPKLELKTINPILAESYKRTTLTGEELLLCVRGTTGTVSISTEELKGCNVTRGIVPIRFKKNLVDLDYAYCLFNSSVLQKQIKSKTYGAALLQINIADIKKLQVPLPKIEEQKKIVAQFNAVNSYIDVLKDSQNKKKKFLIDFKQSILKQAFAGELVKE